MIMMMMVMILPRPLSSHFGLHLAFWNPISWSQYSKTFRDRKLYSSVRTPQCQTIITKQTTSTRSHIFSNPFFSAPPTKWPLTTQANDRLTINTDMRRLTTGIRSAKCVVRAISSLCERHSVYLHKPR